MRHAHTWTRLAGALRRLLLLAAAVLGASAALTSSARAQAPADARWLPWLGCWQAVAPDGATLSGGPQVCVHAAAGAPGVTFASLLAGKVVSQREVVASGARSPIAEGGCRGWESNTWSADARRVYRRSELNCDGGGRRTSTGVISFLPDDRWVDIDAAGVTGAARGVRVQRFRAMSAGAAAATGLMPQGEDLAILTSRTAASGPLLASDVVEASGRVDAEVLQALVYERGNGYHLDAGAVRHLADARVPADVIDLMVALSYPDFFNIDRGATRVALRGDESGGGSGRQPRGGGWGGGYPCYDRYYGGGWGYPGWLFSYPVGYGYSGYGGYYPGGVIVSRGNGSTGGRVVKGGGYERPAGTSTRGTAKPKSGSGSGSSNPKGSGTSTSGGSGSGGGTARPSGGSDTGRTAHPRGQ